MQGISKTAIYVAAGRAVGAREPDADVQNPDYLAEKFLGDPKALDVDMPIVHALGRRYDEAMQDIEVAQNVRMMIVRTRFIDDALEEAVVSGASQILILGAGLDSHAYRCEALLRGTQVFEVDRPETQAFKRQRVREVLGREPQNLRYAAVDFETEDLADVLTACGYDFAQKTFVIMEGLTMYLREAALKTTLRQLAAHPAGSSIVFDFVSNELVKMLKSVDVAQIPLPGRAFVERFLKLIADEPWEFGFPFGEEAQYLEQFGLEVREILMLGGAESVRRYLTRTDGTEVGATAMSGPLQPSRERMQAQQPGMGYRILEVVVARKH